MTANELPAGWAHRLRRLRERLAYESGPFPDVWEPSREGNNDGRVRSNNGAIANCGGHELRAEFIAAAYNALPVLLDLAERMAGNMDYEFPDHDAVIEARRAGLLREGASE